MRLPQDPLLRALVLFGLMGISIAIFVTAGRWWEDSRPDTFVAQVVPPTDYELDQGVACESLFVNQDGKLFAVFLEAKKILIVDAATGAIEKRLDLGKEFRSVNQLLNGDRLYYFLDNTDILVLNPDTAELLDSFSDPKGRYYGRYVRADSEGRLVASDLNAYLSVIDSETGNLIAQRRIPSLDGVLIGDGVIHYLVSLRVSAADPNTLADIWSHGDDLAHAGANVAYSGTRLYYNGVGITKVFDSRTGAILDEFPLQASQIIVAGDRIYSFQLRGGGVSCHQLQGAKLWTEMYSCNSLFLVGSHLYARSGAADTMAKLAVSDGSRVYETNWDKGVLAAIAQAGSLDVIQDSTGQVSLVDGTAGEELWRSVRPPRGQAAPWVLYDGHLILSNGRDKVISYNLKDVRP